MCPELHQVSGVNGLMDRIPTLTDIQARAKG